MVDGHVSWTAPAVGGTTANRARDASGAQWITTAPSSPEARPEPADLRGERIDRSLQTSGHGARPLGQVAGQAGPGQCSSPPSTRRRRTRGTPPAPPHRTAPPSGEGSDPEATCARRCAPGAHRATDRAVGPPRRRARPGCAHRSNPATSRSCSRTPPAPGPGRRVAPFHVQGHALPLLHRLGGGAPGPRSTTPTTARGSDQPSVAAPSDHRAGAVSDHRAGAAPPVGPVSWDDFAVVNRPGRPRPHVTSRAGTSRRRAREGLA